MTRFLLLLTVIFIAKCGFGQLTGVKAIPGDFPSIASAVLALNTQGVGSGGVIFNIQAGFSETFPSSSAGRITATGTESNPIVFQKLGSGPNPVVTAGTGTSNAIDGIFVLAGSDYVTFDGIDVKGDMWHTTDWGFALLKRQNMAPFDGCQNNVIRNCTITNMPRGIYVANHAFDYGSGSLNILLESDANSYNRFYANKIQSSSFGIQVIGFNHTEPPYNLYDQQNEIGDVVNGLNDNRNYISNFGTAAIVVKNQNQLFIKGNVLEKYGHIQGNLIGIDVSQTANAEIVIRNNYFSFNKGTTPYSNGSVYAISGIVSGTGSLTIHHNDFRYINIQGGINQLISISGTTGQIIIANNTLDHIFINAPDLAYLIKITGNTPIVKFNYNTISYCTKTGFSYPLVCYSNQGNGGGISEVIGNIFDSILSNTSGFQTTSVISDGGTGNQTKIDSANTITRFKASSSASAISVVTTGIARISNNIIDSFHAPGDARVISCKALTAYVSKNKILRPKLTGAGPGQDYGISVEAINTAHINNNQVFSSQQDGAIITNSNTTYLYNNMIIGKPGVPLGIVIQSGSAYLFHNSVLILPNFNSPFSAAVNVLTGATLQMKNNILVNLADNAIILSANLSSLSTESNNNMFYAGSPSANHLIYSGSATIKDQTIAAFSARCTPCESNSFTEQPTFVNTGPASGNVDLHLNASLQTGCENAGMQIVLPIVVDRDFDGDPRSSTPEIGADEFSSSLPVKLLNIKVQRVHLGNLLTWQTASESKNLGFFIEKSNDGIQFSNIAFVQSAASNGNSSTLIDYEFTDQNVTSAKTYYRLSQVDFDGRSFESPTVFIESESFKNQVFAAYPNPLKTNVNFRINYITGKTFLLLRDISGRIILQKDLFLTPGQTTINLPVEALQPGIYIAELISKTYGTFALKLWKQ